MSSKVLQDSLGFKMLSAFIAVIIVALSVFTIFAVLREGEKAKNSLREQGEMLVELLSRSSMLGVFAENRKMLKDAAKDIMTLKEVVSISIYGADFKKVYEERKNFPFKGESVPAQPTANDPVQSLTIRETSDIFEFITPVMLQSEAYGDESLYFDTQQGSKRQKVIGYAQIVLTKEGYHKEISSVIKQNIFMMVSFILASTLIVYFAVRKVTRPLEKLTKNVKALGKGLPVEPMLVKTGDEVGNLAAAFNEMVYARSQAEHLLRESEERYRRLVELSPDAIYVQHQGKIVFINASGVKLLGASTPPEITGRPAIERVHENCREIIEKKFLQVEKEGIVISPLQIKYLSMRGPEVDAEIAIAPFTFNGSSAVLVIARDQTERKGMEEMIRSYQKELFSVEARVEERERHLIATDLHDYVGQNLAVLNFKIGMLQKRASTDDAASNLESIRTILEQTIQYTRSLTVELNPPILAELGFQSAVESLAEAFEKRHGIRIKVIDDGPSKQVHGETRYLLFRCVRELLMNIAKHSQASEAVVSVSTGDAVIRVRVEDNGIGFDLNQPIGKKSAFGLFSIRERLKRMGGTSEVESGIGQGTIVTLRAPLNGEAL